MFGSGESWKSVSVTGEGDEIAACLVFGGRDVLAECFGLIVQQAAAQGFEEIDERPDCELAACVTAGYLAQFQRANDAAARSLGVFGFSAERQGDGYQQQRMPL